MTFCASKHHNKAPVTGVLLCVIFSTIVSAKVYNEAGLLKTKYLHSVKSLNQPFMQKIDYKYNIRGWLTRINDLCSVRKRGSPFAYILPRTVLLRDHLPRGVARPSLAPG
jgi:hypothetical protein